MNVPLPVNCRNGGLKLAIRNPSEVVTHKQIPPSRLEEFLRYFKDHKYLTTMIEAVPSQPLAKGFADDLGEPEAVLFIMDWICFLTGKPKSPQAEGLLSEIREDTLVVISDNDWIPVMKRKWGRVGTRKRTAFSAKSLDIEHVQKFLQSIPIGYSLHKVDLTMAEQLDTMIWSHIAKFFRGPANFVEKGVGFVIRDDSEDKTVTLASSYLPYSETLEVDIVTINSPKYRRKGLATIACAKLIEYCLERSIEPHWDAMNDPSVRLALKLGYTDPEPYTLYVREASDGRL